MIQYGLRHKTTGKLAGYDVHTNEGKDFCCDVQTILHASGDETWLVDDPETAEYARLHSTQWYNAHMATPTHGSAWEPDEWEVVKVVTTVEVDPVEVHIPTMEEYLTKKYKKSDPGHYKYCMETLRERDPDMIYSLYELQEWRTKHAQSR